MHLSWHWLSLFKGFSCQRKRKNEVEKLRVAGFKIWDFSLLILGVLGGVFCLNNILFKGKYFHSQLFCFDWLWKRQLPHSPFLVCSHTKLSTILKVILIQTTTYSLLFPIVLCKMHYITSFSFNSTTSKMRSNLR